MKIVDVLGKPCPIPVIEAKKALVDAVANGIIIKVDNVVAVQNLEKMANGYGYGFSYNENTNDTFNVIITKDGKLPPESATKPTMSHPEELEALTDGLGVVISRDTMGEGSEELGKILIKGFIYSLTELPLHPEFVIFLNSGAFLTSNGANTVDDLKTLSNKGTEILTCGTCISYYELSDKPAVGSIANMYEITELIAAARTVVNI